MKKDLTLLILFTSFYSFGQAPPEFTFIPTNSSGTMYGQVQINGVEAENGDWIAAFDQNGNCAGANPLTIYQGDAYINLVIYHRKIKY